MSEYEPLITNETWQEIHGVYRALKRMGCIEGNREPFFAVGQPGFKAQTSKKLSVVFCGIAAGNADGTSADYDAAVEAFDDEHFGLTPDGARPDWGLFWREIADVRLLLRKLLPDREFRAGWANILPINDNCGHTNAPWPELADKQKQEEEDFKRQQAQAMWMKIGLVLLLAGTLFAIIRLYLKRKQREREMEEMQQMLAMDEAADMVGAEAELSPEERRRQEQRQAIEQMAKARPEDIAQMLKAWLTDE